VLQGRSDEVLQSLYDLYVLMGLYGLGDRRSTRLGARYVGHRLRRASSRAPALTHPFSRLDGFRIHRDAIHRYIL